jgi:hypothetical protein
MDYQEKLRLAKEALDSGSYDKETIEYIFPELKNSEDDRVRKCLITFFRRFPYDSIVNAGTNAKEALAWLENQGHDGKKWIYEDVYLKEKEQLIQDGIDEVLENPQKYGLEKQGEQKPDNKAESMEYNYITPNPEFFQWIYDRLVHVHNENPNVDFMLSLKERIEDMQKPSDKGEPKFKVGDWVVHDMPDGRKVIRQIVNMTNKSYILEGEGLNASYFNELENDYHLWTIKDAKDGDVLSSGNPFIFMGFGDKRHPNSPTAYCGINSAGTFILSHENSWWTWIADDVHPATKEQCDLLFQKMHEAGYEWDAEKKELKKIDSYCQKNCKGYQETGRCFADGECQAKKEAECTWSENDEKYIALIIGALEGWDREHLSSIQLIPKCINWLKSIKPHWKPSEEQIKSLRIALQTMPYSKDKENVLVILEELLKI